MGTARARGARTRIGLADIALALIMAFLVARSGRGAGELAGAASDAAHMLTDAASIVLALIAMRLSARPARHSSPTGCAATEILSAQATG